MTISAYGVNYEWLWAKTHGYPLARLQAHFLAREPQLGELDFCLDAFFASLSRDENGVAGSGGWAVYRRDSESLADCPQTDSLDVHGLPELGSGECNRVIEIVAGGEDIADAIEDGAQRLYEFVKDCPGVQLRWVELPLE